MSSIKLFLFGISLCGFSCLQPSESKNVVIKPCTISKSAVKKILWDSLVTYDCKYIGLSNNYDFKVQFTRYIYNAIDSFPCLVKVEIIDKKSQIILDSLTLKSGFYYDSTFTNREHCRSYVTGKNKSKEILDNDYGDIVLADFNFDGREDIAIVNDNGGNAGPTYSFYILEKENKFVLNPFLTDSMSYFPSEINFNKKQLLTLVARGACGASKRTFDFNNGIWKQTKHKVFGICND